MNNINCSKKFFGFQKTQTNNLIKGVCIAFSLSTTAFVYSKNGVPNIITHTEKATPYTYTKNGDTYKWGQGSNIVIDGFEFGGNTYDYDVLADSISIIRVDNPLSAGFRNSIFAEKVKQNDPRVLQPDYPLLGDGSGNIDIEGVMGGNIINRGALDVFANNVPVSGDNTSKNIERVDIKYKGGVTAPFDKKDLSKTGFIATEKGANNNIVMAAITAIKNGEPSAFGPPVMIFPANQSSSSKYAYGWTNIKTDNAFYANEHFPPQTQLVTTGNYSPETLGVVFVDLEALGLSKGQVFYGYSLFGADTASYSVDSKGRSSWRSGINPLDPSTFPNNTTRSYNTGDADIYGGVGGYFIDEVLLSITGTVFDDSNTNKKKDAKELGIEKIAIKLYADTDKDEALGSSDKLISTVNSDANGVYSFTGLPPGRYLVQVDISDTDLSGAKLTTKELLPVEIEKKDFTKQDFGFIDLGHCDANTVLNFDGYLLESGKKKTVGAVYRFFNVKKDVDALVEVKAISNTSLVNIDYTGGGSSSALQVQVAIKDRKKPIPDKHVDLDIRFVEAGGSKPVTIKSAIATAVDIDGDGRGTREYTILQNADSYTLETPTNLTSPYTGRYTSIKSKDLPGIDNKNTEAMVSALYSNVSSIRYTTGITNEGNNYVNDQRKSSLSFECVDYKKPQEPTPDLPVQCYAMNDDNSNLYKFDLDFQTKPITIKMDRKFKGEGAAYRATDNALYAFEDKDLYKVSLDGKSTLIAKDFLSYNSAGAEFVSYTNGSERFVVMVNEKSPKIHIYDAAKLALKKPIQELELIYSDKTHVKELDGLAVNPTTGEVLVIKSRYPGYIKPIIYTVDMNTGVLTKKVTLSTRLIDAESFAFASDGYAYTESDDGAHLGGGDHRIYRINLSTGSLKMVEKSDLSGDIESLMCLGSVIKTPSPPSVARCPNDPVALINKLKIGVPNSPWPDDPSITYTLTATNYQAILPGGTSNYGTPDGAIKGAVGEEAQKKTSTLPAKLNIKFNKPVPANMLYYVTKDIELRIGDDNAATIKVISGTATPADFSHGSWPTVKTTGNYSPVTGKVTMTDMGDAKTGDAGMFWLLGTSDATVQELEISTGSFPSAGDWILSSLSGLSCPKPSIGGIVFKDDNTDDIYDPSESGIANISVSLYSDKNKNGKIDGSDPLVGTLDSDVDGRYKFDNLSDGEYLVQVDGSDGDLGIGFIVGGTNPLAITINGNEVTNADFPFDKVVCTAFSGEISEVALISPAQIDDKDFVIVPSTSVTPNESQGHLRAYEFDSKGAPKTTAKWDAAKKMKKSHREARLYSSKKKGKKTIVKFTTLDNSVFGTSKKEAKAIIKYTIDPSVEAGKYLAGRKHGSLLGSIRRNNGITLLNGEMDTFKYLDDTDYQAYYSKYVVKRDKRVLLGNDDGFLYSFDYEKGDLAWGWMPNSLVKELDKYSTFQSNQYMRGQIDVLDIKSSGKYNPYVVGSYRGGLGHYVLKLNKSSSSKSKLESVVWESDASSSFVASPNKGQMEYFSDDKGNTYAAYAMTNSSNKSTLFIRNLTNNKKVLEISLKVNVTSTPFVMQDYKKYNAPARKTIYIGDEKGKLYSASLLTSKGELRSVSKIKADLKKSIASLATSDTDPLQFIGASVSTMGNGYYLRAQSETRLTVFKYDHTSVKWKRVWSSFEEGSDKWKVDGSSASAVGIQKLPKGATITDNAYIVADSIVLPVNAPDISSVACFGKAYYYLYKLDDGSFPKHVFYKSDKTDVIENIELGFGNATRLILSDLPGKDTLVGFGHADQKKDNTTGVNDTFFIRDTLTTGVRSWRILDEIE